MKKSLPKPIIVPTGKKVALLVNRVTQTAGGVQLPDSAAEQGGMESVTAWVVAVGPECKQLKRGDLVISYLDTPAVRVSN